MRGFRSDQHGQAEAVTLQLTLIVTLLVAVVVVHQIFIAVPLTGEATTSQTTNSEFTKDASGWDNIIQGKATNAWDSGGYIKTISTDNDTITDNGIWSQALTVPSFDEVTSAKTTFKFRVIDNAGQVSIVVKALLDDTVLFSKTITENSATWTTVENDVKSLITASKEYTIYLRAELRGAGTSPNLVVGFDDASLTVTTSLVDPETRDAYNNVRNLAWAGIGLMAISIIILAASVILGVVRGFGGGRGV